MTTREELIESLLVEMDRYKNKLADMKMLWSAQSGYQGKYCRIYQRLVRLGVKQQIKKKYRGQ